MEHALIASGQYLLGLNAFAHGLIIKSMVAASCFLMGVAAWAQSDAWVQFPPPLKAARVEVSAVKARLASVDHDAVSGPSDRDGKIRFAIRAAPTAQVPAEPVESSRLIHARDSDTDLVAAAKIVQPRAIVGTTAHDTVPPVARTPHENQVRSLTAEQVASLAPSKLAELMLELTPQQLMAVTPDQIAALDVSQLNQLVKRLDSALSKMKR